MSDLEFHLTVSIDVEDHEAIEFLRGLAADGLVTRIETDGDQLVELAILDVTTTREQDEAHGVALSEYLGIPDEREA